MPALHTRGTAGRAAAVVLVVAALTLAACASKNKTGTGALGAVTTSPSLSPTPGGNPTTAAPTSTTTTTSTTTKAAPSGPKIDEFSVKQQPTCPVVGTSDSPFSSPGTDIILHWSVSGGATGVGLSLDDPTFPANNNGNGTIGEYGTSGDMELAFTCDITVQPNTTHVYTLDTIGGGKSAVKSLTVTKQTSP